MRDISYDLFKGTSEENALWIETVEGLQAAMDRMDCLALTTPGDYFLFRSGSVVASVKRQNAEQQDTAPSWKIVIASSDSNQMSTVAEILKRRELDPICASTVSECRDTLAKGQVGLVFCDRNLSDGDYNDVINAARSTGSTARIVVTSRQADWHDFMEAMRRGAFDVISTPCRPKDVEWMIIQAKRDERKMSKQFLGSDPGSLARSANA